MVKNNHSDDYKRELDGLLRTEERIEGCESLSDVMDYARLLARIENAVVVVSDMEEGRSHIVAGGFARCLGLADYRQENSIWEKRLLSLMPENELDEKYVAELRFYHYLRRLPRVRRGEYYLMSKLRFHHADGEMRDVLHKMYYIHDRDMETVRFAICIYAPLSVDFKGRSYAVNSINGIKEELTEAGNDTILSPRERQVLGLIEMGMKSAVIADQLNISIHTVSRHRQEIIRKLQVKNSHEACRVAKSMRLI